MSRLQSALRLWGVAGVVCCASAAIAADPAAFFDKSSIVGAGKTISISRVPVRDSSGKIKYYDTTLQFSVDSSGNPSLTSLPIFTPSPTLTIANFKAGTYTTIGGFGPILVTGPGVGGPAGQTSWTLQATTSGCTAPQSATWYTGPIASSPLKTRLQEAGITQTQYSYGIAGGSGSCENYFLPGSLIGAQQVGNTLTLVSFTYLSSQDSPIPQQQVTFKLKP